MIFHDDRDRLLCELEDVSQHTRLFIRRDARRDLHPEVGSPDSQAPAGADASIGAGSSLEACA